MSEDSSFAWSTHLVHGTPDPGGAVTWPLHQSATYRSDPENTSYQDVRYVRLSNTPAHDHLHALFAKILSAPATLATTSGMAAISTALLTTLKHGDHLLATRRLYGGTLALLKEDLPAWGIEVTFVDGDDPTDWADAVQPNTRAFYTESISNPRVEIPDLDAILRLCRGHGLRSMVDNTFASPANFRALPFGFDIVLHSATKYLNGHSDIAAGLIAGPQDFIDAARAKLSHLGAHLDPHAAFLLERGVKTLALRVRQQNATAAALAHALQDDPGVARVHSPILPGHPHHERLQAWFQGPGGVLSFEPKNPGVIPGFLERLRLATFAPSLGGTETLVTLPARTSHATMSEAERMELGIPGHLVRVAVGIEDTGDVVRDILGALRSSA